MNFGEKLRLIRTRAREDASSGELLKITQHPQITKYTMWLMTGQTIPEAGQISPA